MKRLFHYCSLGELKKCFTIHQSEYYTINSFLDCLMAVTATADSYFVSFLVVDMAVRTTCMMGPRFFTSF